MTEQQLADAIASRDLAWQRHELACKEIERLAPIARQAYELQAWNAMLTQRCLGVEERLEEAEAKLAVVQNAIAIERLIDELVELRRIRHVARAYREAQIECNWSFEDKPRRRRHRCCVELDALLGIEANCRGVM